MGVGTGMKGIPVNRQSIPGEKEMYLARMRIVKMEKIASFGCFIRKEKD